MNVFFEKLSEVTRTLLPVMILVLVLCFTIIDVETAILLRFLIGSAMLLSGLSIFLFGIELSMNPIGEYMSKEVATSKTLPKILILGFLLGFLITVAEPDLLILGSQVQNASGHTLSSTLIVYVVSTGVGLMVALGIFRLLRDKPPINNFMLLTYALICILAVFVSEEFLAISFDASGATTGALTTPFILALTIGLANVKGGAHTEENSFGLVGIMSAGPIVAIMSMSVITGQRNISGKAGQFIPADGIIAPFLESITHTGLESFLALLPISLLFFIFNFSKFKIKRKQMLPIIKGLLLTLFGLVLFLTGVNSGFMDMGWIIGMQIAELDHRIIICIGLLLGLIVVLMEPAVHVLGKQIEEVTGGHIPKKLIHMTLSIGVGLAIALSMVRITVPAVKLWYFLLPGFAIAIILSFRCNPVFVGIAFDAGGVASGPMTATFVLAFAQGVASAIPTANVLVDGFGVIAMVAMAPVFSIMILGTVYKPKKILYSGIEEKTYIEAAKQRTHYIGHACLMVVVNRGYADSVVLLARQYGAAGATILHGRGSDTSQHLRIPIINVEYQPEKEIILIITNIQVSNFVADQLMGEHKLVTQADMIIYQAPTDALVKTISSNETM